MKLTRKRNGINWILCRTENNLSFVVNSEVIYEKDVEELCI